MKYLINGKEVTETKFRSKLFNDCKIVANNCKHEEDFEELNFLYDYALTKISPYDTYTINRNCYQLKEDVNDR